MLERSRRLRTRTDITATVRGGRRAGTSRLVVHAAPTTGPARFGLAVSRSVGGSVVRNRVARRLRAVLREQIPVWDELGCTVVVRALPAAAQASSSDLAGDLMSCRQRLARVLVVDNHASVVAS